MKERTPVERLLSLDALSSCELVDLVKQWKPSLLPAIRDLEELEPTAHAASGHFEPLAKYIEAGGELGRISRDMLVKILRGELRFKRGNRRTYAQQAMESRAREAVRGLQRHYAIRNGSRRSRARAIERYLELHPKMSAETLKGYLKRAGGCLSKRELEIIDEVRTEALAEFEAEKTAGKLG